MSHGGRRAGAGRKPYTLAGILRRHSLNALKRAHWKTIAAQLLTAQVPARGLSAELVVLLRVSTSSRAFVLDSTPLKLPMRHASIRALLQPDPADPAPENSTPLKLSLQNAAIRARVEPESADPAPKNSPL